MSGDAHARGDVKSADQVTRTQKRYLQELVSEITFDGQTVRMQGRNAALLAAAAQRKMGTAAAVPISVIDWCCEAQRCQPTPEGLGPCRLAGIADVVAQEEAAQLVTRPGAGGDSVLACPGQLANRLVRRVRNPDGLELACARQLRQAQAVASIRLDAVPGASRNQRRRNDLACIAELA